MNRIILIALLCLPSTILADRILITPVHVVDVTAGEVQANQSVLVEDGRIVDVFPIAGTNPGHLDRTIEGNGGYLIPGLAEMHAHVPPMSNQQQVRNVLTLFLANGITTIRGMLGEPGHLQLRDALDRQEEWTGPRLITSGPSFNGRSVTSAQQGAERARQQAAAGYDFLKFHPGLERDEFDAIVKAARNVGIPFAGHVSQAVGLERTLEVQQDTIDHLDGYLRALVDDPSEPGFFGIALVDRADERRVDGLARATAAADVWNVATQALMEHVAGPRSADELLARPWMRYVSDATAANWASRVAASQEAYPEEQRRRFLELRRATLKALNDAGAGLLLGSDAPQIMNVPGFSTHEELVYLVDAGLTPAEALRTGTSNVAEFFSEPDRGQVMPGFAADLVLLENNPLEDIRATMSIVGVMRAGRWYDRAALDGLLDGVASRP